MPAGGAASVAETVEQLALVDHHVHGPFVADGDEARFARALNEANPDPLRPEEAYDSQLGLAVRRWCAELLDLPRHVEMADYWSRRDALGEAEAGRRFLQAAAVSDWLVDTGFGAGTLLDPTGLAQRSGGHAYEVVRLETLAEEVIRGLDDPRDYAEAFAARLRRASQTAVAAKSVLAYRTGFDVDLDPPDPAAVTAAARRWAERIETGSDVRLDDATLIVAGIYAAFALDLPLQLHVGFGDRDLDLRTVNPLFLTAMLRRPEAQRAPVLLLHCYPYEREAGYLARAFDRVHLDVGLAVPFLGVRSTALFARGLELAPFGKVLYSSDAAGPPELHFLGSRLWREAAASVLGGWVDDGAWSLADARRVATMIGRDNARRVYDL